MKKWEAVSYEREVVEIIEAGTGEVIVSWMGFDGLNGTPKDKLESAKLMASAPELLEELTILRDAFSKIKQVEKNTPLLDEDYTDDDVANLDDSVNEIFGIVNTTMRKLDKAAK